VLSRLLLFMTILRPAVRGSNAPLLGSKATHWDRFVPWCIRKVKLG